VAPWTRAGVSLGAYEDFQAFWREFEAKPHWGQFTVPRVVVWLNGAPGAGKGTNSGYIRDIFRIKGDPIVTSDLLTAPEFEKIKESGHLVQDRDVTRAVFGTLLSRPYAGGTIVDGYPRTAVQAECVKLLHDKILELKQSADFHVVVFEVSEDVSVERQLGRGLLAKRNNERAERTGEGAPMPLRRTDLDPEAARIRYQVFMEQTNGALKVLQKFFPCHRINAEGSFDRVRANIYGTVKVPAR
jgi:adenylate kinase